MCNSSKKMGVTRELTALRRECFVLNLRSSKQLGQVNKKALNIRYLEADPMNCFLTLHVRNTWNSIPNLRRDHGSPLSR